LPITVITGNLRSTLPVISLRSCDSAGSPKPTWADRARKQIYRTDYVLYHYVHYSTVTKGILQTFAEAQRDGEKWSRHFGDGKPSERASDELTDVVMVHAKSLGRDMTADYKERCRNDYKKKWQGCWVAYPWPSVYNNTKEKTAYNEDGMDYNCHINSRVEEYWVPKLRDALAARKKQ
jgi:hypothetical protein